MAKKAAGKKTIQMSKKQAATLKTYGPTMPLAILALVLNILIPGIGSLIASKTKVGIWQLVVVAIGVLLTVLQLKLVGFLIILFAEIWGIFTSVGLIKEAQ